MRTCPQCLNRFQCAPAELSFEVSRRCLYCRYCFLHTSQLVRLFPRGEILIQDTDSDDFTEENLVDNDWDDDEFLDEALVSYNSQTHNIQSLRNISLAKTTHQPTIIEYSLLANTDETSCSICIQNLAARDHCGKLLCNHKCHHVCISTWWRVNPTCPVCRK